MKKVTFIIAFTYFLINRLPRGGSGIDIRSIDIRSTGIYSIDIHSTGIHSIGNRIMI